MKYIRTKDGKIHEVKRDKEEKEFRKFLKAVDEELYSQNIIRTVDLKNIHQSEIVKQSDFLPELCDRCVVAIKQYDEPLYGTFYELNHYIHIFKKKRNSNIKILGIFGANWITGKDGEPILKAVIALTGKRWKIIC